MTLAPGIIRDSIVEYLGKVGADASTDEIANAVEHRLGSVPSSSIRSYLSLNTPKLFERTSRGRYRLASSATITTPLSANLFTEIGKARLFNSDCFDWLNAQNPNSIQAVVTDPPYGLVEYTEREKAKLRNGKGGVWRIPPAFDGHQRAPLPRFTTLNNDDKQALHAFFLRFGKATARVTVPGANIVIASNPLLAHIVADAMIQSGLEMRGYVARQVMTMRGGDRPKNAHEEFEGVSVMPRSQWEPWVVLRKPLDGRVQDNLRRWGTGGFRRPSTERPFGDVIRSHPTPASEKKIAPHPSLKPQGFMRQIVRAVLPLGKGIVLDPFMGGGSTLAAANAVGYDSYGVELDQQYFELAKEAIPKLTALVSKENEELF